MAAVQVHGPELAIGAAVTAADVSFEDGEGCVALKPADMRAGKPRGLHKTMNLEIKVLTAAHATKYAEVYFKEKTLQHTKKLGAMEELRAALALDKDFEQDGEPRVPGGPVLDKWLKQAVEQFERTGGEHPKDSTLKHAHSSATEEERAWRKAVAAYVRQGEDAMVGKTPTQAGQEAETGR